ncbi:MAG: hypothetical protein Faunusvirus40_6 [Faunusvirus sp.]|jgi:hypothetical protein|uniref:Uncharacterized protein n=1 Tax=Faunusvirus sp. TaxID=2487766 RepID=A0A3G4ZXS4_9VIRU|nr:MAG: hypothetical protein Faunusvirus40_6 [Faunusvirus sp.]
MSIKNDNIYKYLQYLDNSQIFLYISIVVISIFLFKKLNIAIISIIGLVFGVVVCYVLSRKQDLQTGNRDTQLDMEYKSMKIAPEHLQEYTDIIDFLYENTYIWNRNLDAYDQVVKSLQGFFAIYENIVNGVEYCAENIDIMVNRKTDALNYMSSSIYSLEGDKNIVNNLSQAVKRLHIILNGYIDTVTDKCDRQYKRQGYNIKTKIVPTKNPGPYPANKFMDNTTNFELY